MSEEQLIPSNAIYESLEGSVIHGTDNGERSEMGSAQASRRCVAFLHRHCGAQGQYPGFTINLSNKP
jgi:hypothetical protein